MAKHRYKDTKHDDKFHEALTKAWGKFEPYAWRVGIAVAALLVLAVLWFLVARHLAAGRDRPWAKHFDIQRDARDAKTADPQKADAATKTQLERMAALAAEYRREPVAAVTLIELSSKHLGLASTARTLDPKTSRAHLKDAAAAAEQFLADFPAHTFVAIAAYNAGRARLELGDHKAAARHFEQAQGSTFPFLAASAKLLAAHCYEKLGRLADARRLYQALRTDTLAVWCAQQAEFRLTQLERRAKAGG